jgi:hypothetical protein
MTAPTPPLTLETAEERERWWAMVLAVASVLTNDDAPDIGEHRADAAVRAYRERCAPTDAAERQREALVDALNIDATECDGPPSFEDLIEEVGLLMRRSAPTDFADRVDAGLQLRQVGDALGLTPAASWAEVAKTAVAVILRASGETRARAPTRSPAELRERLFALVDHAPDDRLREEVENALGWREPSEAPELSEPTVDTIPMGLLNATWDNTRDPPAIRLANGRLFVHEDSAGLGRVTPGPDEAR